MALFEKLVPFHRYVYWVPEALLCADARVKQNRVRLLFTDLRS